MNLHSADGQRFKIVRPLLLLEMVNPILIALAIPIVVIAIFVQDRPTALIEIAAIGGLGAVTIAVGALFGFWQVRMLRDVRSNCVVLRDQGVTLRLYRHYKVSLPFDVIDHLDWCERAGGLAWLTDALVGPQPLLSGPHVAVGCLHRVRHGMAWTKTFRFLPKDPDAFFAAVAEVAERYNERRTAHRVIINPRRADLGSDGATRWGHRIIP